MPFGNDISAMTVPDANILPPDSDIRMRSIVTVWMILGFGLGPGKARGIDNDGIVDKSQ
jgi:hypothetical protein